MPSRRPAYAKARRFVSYLRVSTAKQGDSGLGLDAQREAVARYIASAGPEAVHLAEFREVESGKKSDRPELMAALEEAQLTGAVLVIAKLDRLSRDAHFLLGLQKAGVEFVACDIPEANRLSVGVLAVVAQHEREMIGARTRDALVAKRRALEAERKRCEAEGKPLERKMRNGRMGPLRLGNPNGARCLAGRGNAEAVDAVRASANREAEKLRKRLAVLDPNGTMSARGLAQSLNERGIPTPRDGRWTAQSVIRLKARLASNTPQIA